MHNALRPYSTLKVRGFDNSLYTSVHVQPFVSPLPYRGKLPRQYNRESEVLALFMDKNIAGSMPWISNCAYKHGKHFKHRNMFKESKMANK